MNTLIIDKTTSLSVRVKLRSELKSTLAGRPFCTFNNASIHIKSFASMHYLERLD